MTALRNRLAKIPQIVTVLIVIAVLGALVVAWPFGNDRKTLTVEFPVTNSLYVGSDVRVLGVPIGRVDSLEPRGDHVLATISYDADVDIPAEARAVIISPAIIGDRYVQLAPAYSGGAVLDDGASIEQERTEVPVELDEVYASLSDLAVNLGPDGLNEDGALASFIDGQAELMGGRGEQVNQTISDFGDLSRTLANNADPLFNSLDQVNDFVQLLDRNDARVRSFNTSTALVAEVLEEERQNLADTLEILGETLIDVEAFVSDNRDVLRTNVDNLSTVAALLSKHQESLAELTVSGPVAYSNLAFTYNPYFGTLDNNSDIIGAIQALLSTETVCRVFAQQLDALPLIAELLCEGPLGDLGLGALTEGGLPDFGDLGEGGLPEFPEFGATPRSEQPVEPGDSVFDGVDQSGGTP